MIAIPAILVSFLFIRIQEAQIYKEAVSTANSHVTRLNEQIRSRLGMIESVSRMALAQRAFIDFIHSDMREDGLRLVKFRQNEFEHMHTMILSFRMIESLSFYVQRLMTQVIDKQLVAKNAQLHSLHSQINSHFLYNALESIRMLAEVKRQPEIADVLVSLGSLMRYSMKWQSDTVLLQEELTNIRNYIRFMNFMEGGNLRLQEHIPQDLLRYTIPKMCMQPIVENAVHHAAPKGGSVRIQITAWVADDSMLLIEIRDDGTGIEPQMLANLQAVLRGTADAPIVASKNGLGLENVHKRLQLHYGQDSGLRIDSVKGSYTCVTIRLPWRNSNLGGW